jgi:hypothetical protein
MPNIRFLWVRIKGYLAERTRVRQIKRNCTFLIRTEMMEASVRNYIRDLEAKVDAQGKAIRVLDRQLRDERMGSLDRELDVRETARSHERCSPQINAPLGLRIGSKARGVR